MNTDIVLLYPPGEFNGLCYSLPVLSSFLKQNGFSVCVIDSTGYGFSIEDIINKIREVNPKIIGISIPSVAFNKIAIKTAEKIKDEFNIPLICGGIHATLCPDDLIEYFDFVVKGYGETVLEQMLNSEQKNWKNIDGVVDSADNIEKPANQNLFNFVIPDWDCVSSQRLLRNAVFWDDETACVPVISSRGCPFNCTFCSNWVISGKKVVYRAIDDVLDEVEYMIDKYKISWIIFEDEVFTLNKSRLKEFYIKKQKRSLDFYWGMQTRADLVDKESLKDLYANGCRLISMGVESGNDMILRSINKGLLRNDFIKISEDIKKAGLIWYTGFMIGHISDTIESVWDTICFADILSPDSPGFQLSTPFPKTELRVQAEKNNFFYCPDYNFYNTRNFVSYIPKGLQGYDLIKIRQFAVDYFYSKSLNRAQKMILRGKTEEERKVLEIYYRNLFHNRDKYNFDMLKGLKI